MYLDPGTGSVILQVVLGAIFSIGLVTKIFWSKITAVFKKSQKAEEKAA